MLDSPTSQPNLSRSVTGTLIVFALVGALLIAAGDKDYPELHAILDTGGFLLSGLLASLFWDMGVRLDRPLPKRIAVSGDCSAGFRIAELPARSAGPSFHALMISG